MSGPPPGYNPGESVLSGGSASITPVMGGGGYDTQQSLLSGGDGATIQAVRGGGRFKGHIKRAKSAKARAAAAAQEEMEARHKALLDTIEDLKRQLAQAQKGGAPPTVAVKGLQPAQPTYITGIGDEGFVPAGDQAAAAAANVTKSGARVRRQQPPGRGRPRARPTAGGDNANNEGESASAGAARAKQVRRARSAAPPAQRTRIPKEQLAELPPFVEYYKINPTFNAPIRQIAYAKLQELGSPTTPKDAIPQLFQQYKQRHTAQWQRQELAGGHKRVQATAIPSLDKCPTSGTITDATPQTGFHRLITVLPEDTDTIAVFPPLKGNLALLEHSLDLAVKLGLLQRTDERITIRPGVRIVLPAPIYSTEATQDAYTMNFNILYLFLWIEQANPGMIFGLAEHTSQSIAIACMLDNFRTVKGPSAITNTPFLVNLLEPTYLVYPYRRGTSDGILISAAAASEPALPTSKSGFASFGQFLASGLGEDSLAIAPDTKEDDTIKSYTRVLSVGQPQGVRIKQRKSGPRPATCQDLLSFFPVGPETLVQGLGEDGSSMMMLFRLQPEEGREAPRALCETGVTGGDETVDVQRMNKFQPADDAALLGKGAEVRHYRVPTVDPDRKAVITYAVRIPEPTNKVFEDWVNQRYTADEADFLNSLNLRPHIVDDIFPLKSVNGAPDTRNWAEWVAVFLRSVVTSKCFTDEGLMTRRECRDAQLFVSAVFNYFMEHDAEISGLAEKENLDAAQTTLRLQRERREREQKEYEEDERRQELARFSLEKDPDERGDLLVTLRPREFRDQQIWGEDTQQVAEDLTGQYYTTPVLVVNQKTKEYRLRAFRLPRGTMTRLQAAARFEEMKERFGEQYPGWAFLM